MFIDDLSNHRDSTTFQVRLFNALEFLQQPQTAMIEPPALGSENSQRIELADGMFALVQRYITRTPAEAFWEVHRKHIDVQYVVEGEETMGWAPLSRCNIVKPYDAERDFCVVQPCDATQFRRFVVTRGMFAVFFPGDAHMPGLACDGNAAMVKKIVVKVPV